MQPAAAKYIHTQLLQDAKILVVDDMPVNREILNNMLRSTYQVYTAKDGYEAVEFCHQHRPDLIIMDVEMPGLDGLQACQQIRQTPATALDGSDDEERCWQSGGSDFMHKPLNPTTVRNRVKQQLTLKFYADMLKELVFIDDLTDLLNHRFLDKQLPKEFALALRNKTFLSVLKIDVGDFSQFNQRYGTHKANRYLKLIAGTISECIKRPTDILARSGDQNFCCVLPQTDAHGALTIANTIYAAIDELLVDEPVANSAMLNVRIGAATSCGQQSSYQELLANAEQQRCENLHYPAAAQIARAH